jgi:hypothetical protein
LGSENDLAGLKKSIIEKVTPELWPELADDIYVKERRSLCPSETFYMHSLNLNEQQRFSVFQHLNSQGQSFEKDVVDNLIKLCVSEPNLGSIIDAAKLVISEKKVGELSIGLLIINRTLFALAKDKYFSQTTCEEVIKERETCISHMIFLLNSLGKGGTIDLFDYVFIDLFLCFYWHNPKPTFGFVDDWPLADKVTFLEGYGIFQRATGFTRGSVDPILHVYLSILSEGGETYYDLRHKCLDTLWGRRDAVLSRAERLRGETSS